MSNAIRCPYCAEGDQFKLMQARAEGEWFLCEGCGHVRMPGHSLYKCNCSKCEAVHVVTNHAKQVAYHPSRLNKLTI